MAQLSDRYIKALKAQDKPYIITEESAERGGGRFQVKVYTSGRKQFLIQYFHNKRRRQIGIGNYGAMTLADAGQEFIRLSASVQQGICPKTERQRVEMEEAIQQEEEKRQRAGLRTFVELWDDFYSSIKLQTKIKSLNQLRWMFDSDIKPLINPELLALEFTQDHVRALLKRVIDLQGE